MNSIWSSDFRCWYINASAHCSGVIWLILYLYISHLLHTARRFNIWSSLYWFKGYCRVVLESVYSPVRELKYLALVIHFNSLARFILVKCSFSAKLILRILRQYKIETKNNLKTYDNEFKRQTFLNLEPRFFVSFFSTNVCWHFI